MVTHGEDSLNERLEDEGVGLDDALEDSMDSLRMRLGRPKEDIEPTREQLIATGELDEEPEEVEEERPEEPDAGAPTALVPTGEVSLSIRKQVRKRLLEGATRDELLAEGFNKSTISTVASEVKKETGSRTPIGRAPAVTSKGLPIFAKGSPPEAIIDSIEVPDVTDGQGVPFEQGIKFGMSLLVLATRVVQELAGIGVMQTKPILEVAKSMREGEALAAKSAAEDAAMEAAGMVRDSMMPVLMNISRGGGGEGGDPMRAMMVRTFEPLMQKMLGGVMGRLIPGTAPLQITEGQGKVDGWSRRSE